MLQQQFQFRRSRTNSLIYSRKFTLAYFLDTGRQSTEGEKSACVARRGEQHHKQPQNKQLSPSRCRGADKLFEDEEAADIGDRLLQKGRNARLV